MYDSIKLKSVLQIIREKKEREQGFKVDYISWLLRFVLVLDYSVSKKVGSIDR